MKYTLYTILLITGFSLSGYSQFGGISISGGYNTYQLTEIKDFQKDLADGYSLPIEITDNYPGYIGYRLAYRMPFRSRMKYEVFFTQYATGGKLSYSDYSGSYSLKQSLEALCFGGNVLIPLVSQSLYMRAGLIHTFSSFVIDESFAIFDESETESFKFNSMSIGLEVGLHYEYDFRFFEVFLDADLSMHLPSRLEYEEIEEGYLENSNGKEVNLNWSGLRLQAGIFLPLFPWNEREE